MIPFGLVWEKNQHDVMLPEETLCWQIRPEVMAFLEILSSKVHCAMAFYQSLLQLPDHSSVHLR